MSDMPVEIVPYDPAWPDRFAEEQALLAQVLAPWIDGGLHHVGSTAVPGLAAKPIVDIMVGVADLETSRAAIPVLAEHDYRHWHTDLMPWRHWFLKPEPARRTHHLILVEPDHPEFRARLAFRDALREDDDLRRRYEALKRRLAVDHADDREAYTDAKGEFVLDALTERGSAEGVEPRRYVAARQAVIDTTTIRDAVETDLPSVLQLVEAAGLPTAGIADHFDGFVVAVDPGSGHLLGCGGLERHGRAALLRSVAVSEEVRGSGLGARIVARLLEDASRDGLEEVWLLTETAADWFPRFGFVPATRGEVPSVLGASEELRGACADSAAVLVRRT